MRQRQVSIAILALLTLIMAAAVPAYGQFKVLYNFGAGGTADPCQPQNSGIIAQGRDGNLYSTAPNCGSSDVGAVFKITPSGSFAVTYEMPGNPGVPFSGLTLDPASGNFYGTTLGGGTVDDGTLFNLTPTGILNVLHSFTGGTDGYKTQAPPVIGTDGNLYGTSRGGGSAVCGNGCGVVYKMTPSGTLIWSYEFDLTHGFGPYAPLVQGSDGNFYGTTQTGGNTGGIGNGVVFKITPDGKLTVLHNFCSQPGCADGQYPQSPLIQGSDGNFYGTTTIGGNGYGVVFKITPGGTLTVLHSMNLSTDGGVPYAGLVQASDGNFYGANQNSRNGGGTLFKITPKGVFTLLHTFDGADGAQPWVTLVQHTNGILYGDTFVGGTAGQANCSTSQCGVIYSWNANLKPFIKLLPGSGKVGSKIGILGQGFTSSSVVKFSGVTATTVQRTGSTFLLATVPVGTLDGYVTVTTGGTTLKSLQKFLVHDSWGAGAAMPTPRKYSAAGVINGKVYVVGGNGSSTVLAVNEIYNPATNTWATGADLPMPTGGSAIAVVNNILYVFGGSNDGTTQTNAVWAYNPTKNTWTAKAAMPTARSSAGAAVENNVIYVGGGYGHGNRLATVESYDPATDSWKTEAPLLVAKSEPAVGLVGSTIVAAGGYTVSGDTGDNEGYNSSTNSWKSLATDPTHRNEPCFGPIAGQLYVAGGADNSTPLSVTESFDATANKWTTLTSMPLATLAPGSAVDNGQLYCFGGGNTDGPFGGTIYNNVQIYQP